MITKIKILFFMLFIFTFISCGGGGSNGKDESWGIDQNSGVLLPVCNGDRDTTTNAKKVNPNQTIKKLINPTIIRIWHYQSGEKKACVVQGKAVING